MTLDYRQFLGQSEDLVAPVFERGVAWAEDGRLLSVPGARPGWKRIRVKGRTATVIESLAQDHFDVAVTLERLSRWRGHLVRLDGVYWLCQTAMSFAPVYLPPDEEPAALAPLTARRWPSGDLVWGELGWEEGTEETARRALEEGRGLADVKGMPATLRMAFALAVTERAGRLLRIPASPYELQPWVRDIIERGQPGAQVALANLARQRAEVLAVRALPGQGELPARQERDLRPLLATPPASPIQDDLEARLELCLRKAGAQFRALRRSGTGQVEVTWQFQGQRLISVVNERTLQIQDAGICLTDHGTGVQGDRMLTLDSLPGVVREAIANHKLVITRRDGYADRDDDEDY